jgi:hypothetical protein
MGREMELHIGVKRCDGIWGGEARAGRKGCSVPYSFPPTGVREENPCP